MALIYVIVDFEDRIPILTATSISKAEDLLQEYVGQETKLLGFFKYESKYGDIYEGVYKYETEIGTEKFIRYCMSVDKLN